MTCECSEDYGPCEDHGDVLCQREGGNVRTADELAAVFMSDAVDLLADVEGQMSEYDAGCVVTARELAEAYWTACPNGGWLPTDDDPRQTGRVDLAEALYDHGPEIEGLLSTYLSATVWWEDGYVISLVTGGPLSR